MTHPTPLPRATATYRRPILVPLMMLLALVGCKSSGQTDLVEREMRQQEDQIYAMQDYLNNYQQLLCQTRAENEVLKQQLAEGQSAPTFTAPKSEIGKSRLKSPAQTPVPPSGKAGGPRLGEPETHPGVPKLEMGDPEVPPLRDTSAEDQRDSHYDSRRAREVAANQPEHAMQNVNYEAESNAATSAAPAMAAMTMAAEPEPLGHPDQPQEIVLQGQVVADDENGSPHVLVDVKPQLASGQPADYRGRLSLMLIDPNREPPASNIARWDFAAEELNQANVTIADSQLLEFPLQLPEGVPTNRPLELWVRLLPAAGGKILAHATVDLSRASGFSSAGSTVSPAIERPRQIVDRSVAPAQSIQGEVRETGWQVARPDQRSEQPPRQGTSSSGWRTANEAIPIAESIATRLDSPQPPPISTQSLEPSRPAVPAARIAGRQAPEWSPERADDCKPASPSWTPTR